MRLDVISAYERRCKISIHAPRVRCDGSGLSFTLEHYIFQSTHLVWGATLQRPSPWQWKKYFNPRTSCEVRLEAEGLIECLDWFQSTHLVWGATSPKELERESPSISIHAPRVRCDLTERIQGMAHELFQSTHLVWGATSDKLSLGVGNSISIHAPRVRCDPQYER